MTGNNSHEIDQTRDDLLAHAQRYADLGMRPEADELAGLPDFPPAPSSMPLIIDTDLGGDPDDSIALVAAAWLPELAMVVTSDEHAGHRARLARHLLDLLGRPDVPVIAGRDLGNTRYWAADGLLPDHVPDQPTDVLPAVSKLLDRHEGQIRWLGIGPWSNLADLLTARPESAHRLSVTLMGGGLNYRHADRAEHNIRLDPDAARVILANVERPRIVPSDLSFHPANEITADSAEYRVLTQAGTRTWAVTVQAHIDQWFARFHPGTMQHDALALALAMGLPFLDTTLTGIDLDSIGRMTTGTTKVHLAHAADYRAFRQWLTTRLHHAATSAYSPPRNRTP